MGGLLPAEASRHASRLDVLGFAESGAAFSEDPI